MSERERILKELNEAEEKFEWVRVTPDELNKILPGGDNSLKKVITTQEQADTFMKFLESYQ